MKVFYALLFSSVLFLCNVTSAQNYPLAPEKWSTPKLVKGIPEHWEPGGARVSSVSWDGKKLFFDGFAYLQRTDTGFGELKMLNGNIDQHLVRHAFISPNGKKLFFIWYTGGYYMYYSDWDSIKNDWGIAKDAGNNINLSEDGSGISAGVMPNDTTIIFLSNNISQICLWDKAANSWGKAKRFPGKNPYFFFISSWNGLHVTPDMKKVYSEGGRADSLKGGRYYLNEDIHVYYIDSTTPRGYRGPYILNISLEADSMYWNGTYKDRFESNPVLTPDGKTLYFTACYSGINRIYESHMIIDEHGDSILTSVEKKNIPLIPQTIKLFPPYPNPFNPETVIIYHLASDTEVEINLHDILGRKISTLVREYKRAGEYEVHLNIDKYSLSSGIYIIQMKTPSEISTQKAMVVK